MNDLYLLAGIVTAILLLFVTSHYVANQSDWVVVWWQYPVLVLVGLFLGVVTVLAVAIAIVMVVFILSCIGSIFL